MKLFNPEAFQGNFRKKKYFEGWYFKHVSSSRNQVFSFIPGVSFSGNEQHAFIQFIDGITGKTAYIKYPVSAFDYIPGKMDVTVGDSRFSGKGIELNIQTPQLVARGKLTYSAQVKYPGSFFSPGIMGWYSFVPFMECKHGIGSVIHRVEGQLSLGQQGFDLTGGTGYIEKDWGTSFPESWIWLHCNTFDEPDCSFMFSVAKIPWLGSFFIGHICFLYLKGEFYIFATYNKSRITHISYSAKKLNVELVNRKYRLKITAFHRNSGHLKAPETGRMERIIKESIDSGIELRLDDLTGENLFTGKGTRAGMELAGKIPDYFK